MSTRRRTTPLSTAALVALMLAAAPSALAQGDCSVELNRSDGRVVVTGNFGDPVVVTLFRDGERIRRAQLANPVSAPFRYEFTATTPGRYRVLVVTPETECGDEASFTVLPATATERPGTPSEASSDTAAAVLVLIALGLLFGVRRTRQISGTA